MMFSTLCSPSSSEEKRSSSASEDIPFNKASHLASPFTRYRRYTLALLKTFQGFCQCGHRVFQTDCPEVQPHLGSLLDFLLVARVKAINPFLTFACFKAQSTLALFFIGFLTFDRLVQFLVLKIHRFPLWSFDSLENGLAEGVPVLIHERYS